MKVFGVIRALSTSEASYSLDGGDSTFFRTTAGVLTVYELLYTSPVVGNGQHILTIENLGDEFFVDYFNVTTGVSTTSGVSTTGSVLTTGSVSTNSSTRTSSAGLSSSSSVTTTLVTLRSSGSSTASSDVPPASTGQNGDANLAAMPPNNTQRGAIIGASVALGIIAFFGIFLWLRRRRKQEESEGWIISSCQYLMVIFIFVMFDEVYLCLVSAARAASSTTFLPEPTITPPTDQQPTQQPLQPPSYPMSEPPAYDSDIGPAIQVSDSQLLRSSRDAKR